MYEGGRRLGAILRIWASPLVLASACGSDGQISTVGGDASPVADVARDVSGPNDDDAGPSDDSQLSPDALDGANDLTDGDPPFDGAKRGWSPLPSPATAPLMAWFAEAPSDPSIVLAGADAIPTDRHHFFRSVDGGSTWAPIHQPRMLQRPVFAPSDAKVAYAVQVNADSIVPEFLLGTIVRSLDGGVTWETCASGEGVIATAHLAVDPHNPAKVYIGRRNRGGHVVVSVSADGGATWADSASVAGLGLIHAFDIAIDPTNVSRIYVVIEDDQFQYSLLVSNNGGSSWQTLRAGPAAGLGGNNPSAVRAFAIAPNDPDVLYLLGPRVADTGHDVGTSAGSLCRSGDRGATWSCHAMPESSATVIQRWSLIGVDAKDPHTVVIANAATWVPPATLYRSKDDGTSWTPLIEFEVQPSTSLPDAALVSSSVGGRILVAKNGVARSTDGGTTFEPVTQGPKRFTAASVVMARDDDRVLWLGERFYPDTYLTSDRGASWAKLGPFAPDAFRRPGINDITYVVSHPGKPRSLFWYNGSEEIAEPSGALTILNPSSNGLATHPIPPPDAGGDAGTAVDTPFGCSIAVDAPAIRYCCTLNGLYGTSDAGQHWSPTSLTAACTRASVDPRSSSIVYVTSSSGSLRRTDDGGATFVDLAQPGTGTATCDVATCSASINDMLLDDTDPSHVVISCCSDGFYTAVYHESFDRGASWKRLDGDFAGRKLYLDPRDSKVLYAAGVGGVRKSRDGGASWFDVSTGLDFYGVCDLQVSRQQPGVVYAAVCSSPPQTGDRLSERHGLYWTTTGGE